MRCLETISMKAGDVGRDLGATCCLVTVISSLVALPVPAAAETSAKALTGAVAASPPPSWTTPLSKDEKVLQLLNRITFGPRPGDVERVERMGIKKFLDQQLHPERINDSEVEAKVAALSTLSMSTEELAEDFQEMRAERRAQMGNLAGQKPELVGQKPEQASFLDVLKSTRQNSNAMERQSAGSEAMTMTPASTTVPTASAAKPELPLPRRVIVEMAQEEILRAVYSDRQLQEVMVQFWMNHFNIFVPKGADRWLTTSFERDTIRPHAVGKFEDLLEATAKSPAMLFYLDNWMSATPNPAFQNRPAPPRPLARTPYGVWRPFGLPPGQATRAARGNPMTRPVNPNAKRATRGLNENYARELMELHTLGVNGGYTQQDVIEVARCLTGWTIDRPGQGGGFIFRPGMHDYGEKVVLGHTIPAGRGMEDGLEVLHQLAHQPATAHFIALKLCRRFVADDPPPGLVDRAAKTFLAKDGDLRAVLKTILTSREFYSEAAYRAKVKSPMELVASTIRALGATTDAGVPLVQLVAQMGQPMFQYQAPTGFPDRASTWINSSALLMRMNFAMALAGNRIVGTRVDFSSLDAAPAEDASPGTTGGTAGDTADSASVGRVMDTLAERLFHGTLSAQTRETILEEMTSRAGAGGAGGTVSADRSAASAAIQAVPRDRAVAALLIASPDFQRR